MNLKTRQRGVGAWSDLSMLKGSMSRQDEAPLHTFHENTEQDTGNLQLQSEREEEMGKDKTAEGREVVERSEEKAGA